MKRGLDWLEQPISREHDRETFDCGVPALNLYLSRYARRNHLSGGAKTFVAAAPGELKAVLGYYSIAPGEIEFEKAPARLLKGHGHYDLPVFRLARLAVSRSQQGFGLGMELLAAAGLRALSASADVGGVALAIDAKDADVARWYARFGALPLLDDPLRLILPLDAFATGARIVGRR